MKKTLSASLVLASTLLATNSYAAEIFNTDAVYAGGGLSVNSLSDSDFSRGYQVFAGLPLNVEFANVKSAVEVGYMDSGDISTCTDHQIVNGIVIPSTCVKENVAGVWLNYVATMQLTDSFKGIARAGLDFGDDDGVMVGVGAEYGVTDKIDLRGEYVSRDTLDSVQMNLVYHIK